MASPATWATGPPKLVPPPLCGQRTLVVIVYGLSKLGNSYLLVYPGINPAIKRDLERNKRYVTFGIRIFNKL